MGVKFIKVRFNLDDPNDRTAYEIVKRVPAQNKFIKNAILEYDSQKRNESLAENIINAIRSELSKVQLPPSSYAANSPETAKDDSVAASMDIADDFLDSL